MIMKKKIVFTSALLATSILGATIAVGANQTPVPETVKVSKVVKEKQREIKTEPLHAVSEKVLTDFETAKTKYTNLKFKNITPVCPNLDSVYELKDTPWTYYKGITTDKEIYEESYRLFSHWMGEELNQNRIETDYYNMREPQYPSFQAYLDALESGVELKPSSAFVYLHGSLYECVAKDEVLPGTQEYGKGGETYPSMERIIFNKGRSHLYDFELGEDGETPAVDIKSYYVYNSDDNLDDVYPLLNGEISIRDAIAFTENYLNNELGLEGEDDNIFLKVESVHVKKCNGVYRLSLQLRRELLGVLCPAHGPGDYNNGYVNDSDYCYANMFETDSLDSYHGLTRISSYEKSTEYNEVISLDTALELVSKRVGKNSTFTTEKIEFSYQNEAPWDSANDDNLIRPCWYIEGVNSQCDLTTAYFVDAITGEIRVSTDRLSIFN